MAQPDMKALLKILNPACKQALADALSSAVARTHYQVCVEHVLDELLNVPGSDAACICDHFKVNQTLLRQSIHRALDELKTGDSGRPQWHPNLVAWLGEAWQIASLELGQPTLRSGALILGLLRTPEYGNFQRHSSEWEKLDGRTLQSKFLDITLASDENQRREDMKSGEGAPASASSGGAGPDAIDKFCVDLTESAKRGELDPVIGRDREIRQCIDILMRRFQNNPLLLGEPGTGKTAIVEGLALRIASGDVPPFLADQRLMALDIGALRAGASVGGEFEKRIKGIIESAYVRKEQGRPVILFIDEAHMLIGGGGPATDAANLLKPALARGKLRTIAATTFAEYKKYIEKDPPFAQRFGIVKIEEPSVEVCVDMLRGTKDKFEKHHKVNILDDAVRSAVSMSQRYLSESQLPRKAVSLLDTASARVAVNHTAMPGPLEDIRRRIIQIEVATKAIQRDHESGNPHDADELAKLKSEIGKREKEFTELKAKWDQERELALAVVKLREELNDARALLEKPPEGTPPEANPKGVAAASSVGTHHASGGPPPRPVEEIRKDLDAATKKLESCVGKRQPLVPLHVDADVVAGVLSDWTGIPAGNMVKDQAAAILTFEDRIGQRVVGQDHAIAEIGKRLRIATAKLHDPVLPLAVFLLVGPSGTGKTETALAVADLVFGGERFMTGINMTEYSSSMNVSRLIGSAPGLVGFGEGGVLTEAVRKRPYSVILLDEMEKAHMDVNLLFMQVFDKGALTDSEGRTASFKNTVIMMTSNEGAQVIHDLSADGEKPTLEEMRKAIQPALEKRFTPAFVGRTTVIPFYPLDAATLRRIVDLKMEKIRKRLLAEHKITMEVTPAVGDEIGKRCNQVTIGARLINLIINETVQPEISQRVLERMDSDSKAGKLVVDVDSSGAFTYTMA